MLEDKDLLKESAEAFLLVRALLMLGKTKAAMEVCTNAAKKYKTK